MDQHFLGRIKVREKEDNLDEGLFIRDEGTEHLVTIHVCIKELMPVHRRNKARCRVVLSKTVENLKCGMKECRNAREIIVNRTY